MDTISKLATFQITYSFASNNGSIHCAHYYYATRQPNEGPHVQQSGTQRSTQAYPYHIDVTKDTCHYTSLVVLRKLPDHHYQQIQSSCSMNYPKVKATGTHKFPNHIYIDTHYKVRCIDHTKPSPGISTGSYSYGTAYTKRQIKLVQTLHINVLNNVSLIPEFPVDAVSPIYPTVTGHTSKPKICDELHQAIETPGNRNEIVNDSKTFQTISYSPGKTYGVQQKGLVISILQRTTHKETSYQRTMINSESTWI